MKKVKGMLQLQLSTDLAPLFSELQDHHVTLAFGVVADSYIDILNTIVNVRAVRVAWNDDIQAVRVELPASIPCKNANPHVTVSHRKGVKPVASNKMLSGEHESAPLDIPLTGRVVFVPFAA